MTRAAGTRVTEIVYAATGQNRNAKFKHWGTYREHRGNRQPDRQGARTVGLTGALPVVQTEDMYRQPVRQDPLRHCILYIQRALATSWGEGRLGTEGTDNQSQSTLGYCELYTQRAQTTSQTGAHWDTVLTEGK